jgi:fermentation-respiration switch protein FrsA (DUF1100 family)
MRRIATILFPLFLAGCVNGYFFHPTRVTYQTPRELGLPYEHVEFESLDGTRLAGWFVPARGRPLGTVIHFHGNAQNMSAHFSFVSWLPEEGFNVFVFDYRGYGQSEGAPDRDGVYEDSVAALRYVASRGDVDGDRLIVLGQSLGGANAMAALARDDAPEVRAVVLDSVFYSYRSIVRDKIALIPVLGLLRWPLSHLVVGNAHSPSRSVKKLPAVPVLFIHGTGDAVVPYHHSVELYEKAHEPKAFWTVEGGRHADAFVRPNEPYRKALVAFLTSAVAAPGRRGP